MQLCYRGSIYTQPQFGRKTKATDILAMYRGNLYPIRCLIKPPDQQEIAKQQLKFRGHTYWR